MHFRIYILVGVVLVLVFHSTMVASMSILAEEEEASEERQARAAAQEEPSQPEKSSPAHPQISADQVQPSHCKRGPSFVRIEEMTNCEASCIMNSRRP